jgi:hypothetical protein
MFRLNLKHLPNPMNQKYLMNLKCLKYRPLALKHHSNPKFQMFQKKPSCLKNQKYH